MDEQASRKQGKNQRHLTLMDGGQTVAIPRRRNRGPDPFATGDFRLEREMVSAFAAIYGEDGTVPSKGIYNIRSLDHKPWRTLAKRLREAIAAGAPREQVEGVLKVFALWVAEQYPTDETGKAA